MDRDPDEDAELFRMFRVADADGGVIRSYACGWAGWTAIAWSIEKLWNDPAARIVLLAADHHLVGSSVYESIELFREGDQIRTGDHMVASFGAGIAYATAELAFALNRSACRHEVVLFRQP